MFITSIGSAFGVSSISQQLASATVPGAPTIGTATRASSTSVTVSFTAPASNGGATITSYTAVSSPSSLTGTVSQSGSGSITVTGLTTGTAYTFVVYATNRIGNSTNSSSSNSVTPNSLGLSVTSSGGQISQLATIVVDSSGTILCSGSTGSSYNAIAVESRTNSGALNYVYNYQTQSYLWNHGIAIERSNTSTIDNTALYVSGTSDTVVTFATAKLDLFKMTVAGVIGTRVRLTNGSSYAGPGDQNWVAADHTGPAVICFLGSTSAIVAKFNTSMAIQWQKSITNSSVYPRAVSCRETYVYSSSDWFSGSAGGSNVIKFTSAGAVSWQRQIGTTSSTYLVGEAMDIDNNGNVIVGGRSTAAGAGSSVICSLSAASGATNWSYTITSTEIWGIHYSKSQSCIYVIGSAVSAFPVTIIKFDLSGNVLWKRTMGGSGTVPQSMSTVYTGVNDTTYFYVAIGQGTIFKLLADGTIPSSLESPFTYAAASNTISSFTITNAAGSATVATSSLTVSNPSTPLVNWTSITTQTVTNY